MSNVIDSFECSRIVRGTNVTMKAELVQQHTNSLEWVITCGKFICRVRNCTCPFPACPGTDRQAWNATECALGGKRAKERLSHSADFCHGVHLDRVKRLVKQLLATYK